MSEYSTPEENALAQAVIEDHGDSSTAYVAELEEALCLLLRAFDSLLPGGKHIAVDIGLLNEAAMKARPLVEKIEND